MEYIASRQRRKRREGVRRCTSVDGSVSGVWGTDSDSTLNYHPRRSWLGNRGEGRGSWELTGWWLGTGAGNEATRFIVTRRSIWYLPTVPCFIHPISNRFSIQKLFIIRHACFWNNWTRKLEDGVRWRLIVCQSCVVGVEILTLGYLVKIVFS